MIKIFGLAILGILVGCGSGHTEKLKNDVIKNKNLKQEVKCIESHHIKMVGNGVDSRQFLVSVALAALACKVRPRQQSLYQNVFVEGAK